jgi:hypothetical protein
MSMMQTFRDGPIYRSGLWRDICKVFQKICALALMILTMVNYAEHDIQRATLDAVLVLWLTQPDRERPDHE